MTSQSAGKSYEHLVGTNQSAEIQVIQVNRQDPRRGDVIRIKNPLRSLDETQGVIQGLMPIPAGYQVISA